MTAMADVTADRPFHLVVFGATGFTGGFVVEEVARRAKDSPGGGPLKWAVAGRCRRRLEDVLDRAADRLSMPELRTDVEIIVADVSVEESLAAMCRRGLVVLNCVGPYRFYGEPVVKACIANGAHYLDICGEPQFLERMQLEYHAEASAKGVYVIGSCGFDSIPADLGIIYTKRQFKGTLTAVESFLTISSGPKGMCGHDATWQSAVYGFADGRSLRRLRKEFGHKPLPTVGAKVTKRGFLFYSKEVQQYVIPFMGSDPSVVRRTQRFLYEEEQQSPVGLYSSVRPMMHLCRMVRGDTHVHELKALFSCDTTMFRIREVTVLILSSAAVQYSAYVGVGGLLSVAKLLCGGLLFWVLVKFSLGRKLLTTFPSFFSFGLFSKSGPTMTQIENTCFSMTFFGEGYAEGSDPSQGRPDTKICTEVVGAEPGYVATVSALVQAGVTVLRELHSLPGRGGVYSPGAAFNNTSLIERLHKHSISFSVRNQSRPPPDALPAWGDA